MSILSSIKKLIARVKVFLIITAILALYCLIKLFVSKGFINDWLKLSSFDNTPDYFQLLLNVTASIFGIIVTVTLLTFQLIAKDNPLRNKKDNLFNNTLIAATVSLPISIVILSLFSYLTIKDFKQDSNLTIGYFLGLLFITFIVFLYWEFQIL